MDGISRSWCPQSGKVYGVLHASLWTQETIGRGLIIPVPDEDKKAVRHISITGGTYHFIFMWLLYCPGGLDLGLCGLVGILLCFTSFLYLPFLFSSFSQHRSMWFSHTRNLLTSTGAGDMTIYLLHSFDYDSWPFDLFFDAVEQYPLVCLSVLLEWTEVMMMHRHVHCELLPLPMYIYYTTWYYLTCLLSWARYDWSTDRSSLPLPFTISYTNTTLHLDMMDRSFET